MVFVTKSIKKELILKTRLSNGAAVGLAALLLASALQAQAISSGHWKSKGRMEGGPQGEMNTESELWMKDKKVRIKTKVMGMEMNVVRAGDFVYQWQDGQTQGMKMPANVRRRSGASLDYIEKMDEIRTKGKKVGTETVDGHSCDIYEYTETPSETETQGQRGPMKGKYWLARDLKNFPIKTVMENGDMTITTTNYDIKLNASVPDNLLTPPENVKFQDMSEMMKGMAPKK
jgi:hypothetical protein